MKNSKEITEVFQHFKGIAPNKMINKEYSEGVIDALEWVLEFDSDNNLLHFLKITYGDL